MLLTICLSLTLCLTSIHARLDPEEPLLYDSFPDGFVWGVASSAYQVEGGWDEGGKGLSNWDKWTEDPSHTTDSSSGKVSADSYHKYKEDVQLAADMGVGVYRVSVAWSRIIPEGLGAVSPEVGQYVFGKMTSNKYLSGHCLLSRLL